jgi:hypothetical protein
MAKDKKDDPHALVHLGFRGNKVLTERIDKLRTHLSFRLGGMNISRSQVLEVLVRRALPLVEAEQVVEIERGQGYAPSEITTIIRLVAKEEARIRKLREQLPDDD